MTDPFSHLHSSIHSVMREDAETRLKHIESDRWIGYPQAQALLDQMAFLMQHAKNNRMPNMLIVGDTNNGKTQLVKRFRKRHPAVHDPRLAKTTMPVLFVETPPVPDAGTFYNEVLDAFYAPYRPQDHHEKKRKQAFHYIERSEVKLLIIDEIHNGLAGRTSSNRQFMNVIRYLSNKLQIPIIAVGTMAALRAMQTDEQNGNRFEPAALPRWKNDDAWKMFIKRYTATLPLLKTSDLHEDELATYLFMLSEGLVGELAATLRLAARSAIQSEKEKIDMKLLKGLKRVRPSERRSRAEQLVQ